MDSLSQNQVEQESTEALTLLMMVSMEPLSQEAVYMAMVLYDFFNTRGFMPVKLIQNQVEQESTEVLNSLNDVKIKSLKNDIAKLQGLDCPYPELTRKYLEAQFKQHPYEVYWGISQDDREMK